MTRAATPKRAPAARTRSGGTSGPWRTEPARQQLVREHNLALVLSHILEPKAPVTRAQIAQATGLTRATVSDLVESLVRGHMVTELAPRAAVGAGRPGVPLAPASGTIVGIGAEVAVDRLGVTAIDLSGRAVNQRVVERDLRGSDPQRTLARLSAMVREVVGEVTGSGMTPAGACLALPGIVDASGMTRFAPNLGWQEVPALDLVRTGSGLVDLSWSVGNDADLAARAECQARARAAEHAVADEDFVYVAGNVGLGGAVIRHGFLAGGVHGWVGEIGHSPMDPLGPDCACGANGCLEQYAGRHIVMTQAGLAPTARIESLLEALGEVPEGADEPARERHTKAVTAVDVAARAIGLGAATMVNIVDVEVVVLGSMYADLFAWVAPTVQREVDRRVMAARWAPVRVERALVTELASLRGAALSVLEAVAAAPSSWTERS